MNELSGLILLDKPSGPTSHDMVDEARRKLKISRIGHAGTLDPAATGLLVLLVGKAAKKQSEFLLMNKVYSGKILFGTQTDTWDLAGKIIEKNENFSCEESVVSKFIPLLQGEIKQKIPPYSAVKRNGVPLYKLARKNLPVPNLEKKVTVKWLTWQLSGLELFFRVSCSSGTYVRSLAYELGELTGYKAVLKTLRREEIGPYKVEEALDLEKFKACEPDLFLKPV